MELKKNVKSEGNVKKARGNKKNKAILGIRFKIYMSFIVPILLMGVVGYVAYHYAESGLISEFEDSATQTVNMAVEYLDLVDTNIQAEASRYVMDKDFESYVLGMPGKSKVDIANYYSAERLTLMSSQSANPYINNFHLIPKNISSMITTAASEKVPGVYDDYISYMKDNLGVESDFPNWITSHPFIDEQLKLNPQETFISYQVQDSQRMAYIIIDIKKEAMSGVLSNIDFGDGSYVGLITDNGNEVSKSCGADALSSEAIFISQSFYTDSMSASELSGAKEVKFNGKDYYYLYQKSDLNGLMLCALIPYATIVGQAESIKSTTVILVIVAAIIAMLIGTVIAGGIQRNMKRISKKLDEVAKGNLTVSVEAKGHDEFQSLASAATNMVSNNKNLIESLVDTANSLQNSALSVNEASEVITNYSGEITQAIDEISKGMEKQSEHALECVNITNTLSDRISDINGDVESVHKAIIKAEGLIEEGMAIVENLTERAEQTAMMTERVGETIARLESEAGSISRFVQTINSISEQTNLLSLNASIEAARAGEAGKGFAVVAEEIRNLADDSSAATVEIENKIKNIDEQTSKSVESADNAKKMVALQQESVNDVIKIFNQISEQMQSLISELDKITESAKAADKQRSDTVDAVDNISAIIEQTAASSNLVHDMAVNLLDSVDRLGQTADSLDENMKGLKKEISVFKV